MLFNDFGQNIIKVRRIDLIEKPLTIELCDQFYPLFFLLPSLYYN